MVSKLGCVFSNQWLLDGTVESQCLTISCVSDLVPHKISVQMFAVLFFYLAFAVPELEFQPFHAGSLPSHLLILLVECHLVPACAPLTILYGSRIDYLYTGVSPSINWHQVHVFPTMTRMVLFIISLMTLHNSTGPLLLLLVRFHCHVVGLVKSAKSWWAFGFLPGSLLCTSQGSRSFPAHNTSWCAAAICSCCTQLLLGILGHNVPSCDIGCRSAGRWAWLVDLKLWGCSSPAGVGFGLLLLSVLVLLKWSQPLRICCCQIPIVVGPLLRLVVMVHVSSGSFVHPWMGLLAYWLP